MKYYIIISDADGKVKEGYEVTSPLAGFKTAFSLHGNRANLVVEIPLFVDVKPFLPEMFKQRFENIMPEE